MNLEDIKIMQKVASRLTKEKVTEWMEKNKEIIDAKMEEIRKEEIEDEDDILINMLYYIN